MSDRITNGQLHRTMLRNLQTGQRQVNETVEKLSSGYAVNRPSDNPFGAARTTALQSEQSSYDQYESSLKQARTWTELTDTALSSTGDLMQRARDLLIKAGNDTMGPDDLQKIADEIEGLIDSIKTQANTKVNGEYIFSGGLSTTAPYQLGAVDTYNGNGESVQRQIAPGVVSDINETGDVIFGDDSNGIIGTLRTIVSHLRGGTPADREALRGSDLVALTADQDVLLASRARIGERQIRFEHNLGRLDQMRMTSMELLSSVRDTDYPKEMMNYAQQYAALEAALRTGQKVVQPSLVDFLS